jgi:hypothetical protein
MTRTYSHENGVGIAGTNKRLARLVSDVADGKFRPASNPPEKVTLSKLIDEWIAHGETARIKASPAALNQAKRWKYIPANPANDVRLHSGGRPEMQVPTAAQARH